MKVKSKVLFIFCLVLFFTNTIFVFGQETEIKDKKITLKVVDQPLASILTYLMVEHDIQIGFEESMLDEEHYDYYVETDLPYYPKEGQKEDINLPNSQYEKFDGFFDFSYNIKNHLITVDAENKSLAEVFDSIVAQMENYSWEINDGVFNIYPKKGRNPMFEKLLKLNVKNFNLKSGTFYSKFRNALNTLPEVKQFFTENKLEQGTQTGTGSFFSLFRTEKEINFSNLTVKELLNKITKIKGGGWRLAKSKRIDEKNSIEKTFIMLEI